MFHGRSLTSPSVFDLLVLVIAPPLLVSVLLLLLLSLSRILQVGVGDGAGIIGVLAAYLKTHVHQLHPV